MDRAQDLRKTENGPPTRRGLKPGGESNGSKKQGSTQGTKSQE